MFLSERKLCKFLKKRVKAAPRFQKRVFVLATQAARHNVDPKCRELYMTPQAFLLKFNATERVVCPGWYGGTSSGGLTVGGIS